MRFRRTTHAARRFPLMALIALLPLATPSPAVRMGTWANQAPAAGPSARYLHAMAPIGEDLVLLYGGNDGSSFLGDTWLYDLGDNTWTNLAPAGAPSARGCHAMAYLGGDKVLLFGGVNDRRGFAETWTYDLSDNSWTWFPPAIGPPERHGHAMAYLGGDQVLLFGGYDGSGPFFGDTWVYDRSDNTWTEQAPGAAPPGRDLHAMASLGGGRVLVFGGRVGYYDPDGETWVYDSSANSWTQLAPAASPSARYVHAMASPGEDQVLLFGGNDDSSYLDDTWLYDLGDNTWTEQVPAAAPSARGYAAMASLGTGQVLLFGGWDGSYLGDTWLATGFGMPPFTVYLPLVIK